MRVRVRVRVGRRYKKTNLNLAEDRLQTAPVSTLAPPPRPPRPYAPELPAPELPAPELPAPELPAPELPATEEA